MAPLEARRAAAKDFAGHVNAADLAVSGQCATLRPNAWLEKHSPKCRRRFSFSVGRISRVMSPSYQNDVKRQRFARASHGSVFLRYN